MKKKLRIISLFIFFILLTSSNSLSDNLCTDLIANGRFKVGMSKTEIEKSFGETLRGKKLIKSGNTYFPLIRLKNSGTFEYTTNVQPHFGGTISFEFDSNNKLIEINAHLQNIMPNDIPKIFDELNKFLSEKFGTPSVRDFPMINITSALWEKSDCVISLNKRYIYGSPSNNIWLSIK